MKKFQIESEEGVIMGVFEGVDEAEALDAMMVDAGYESFADYKVRCDRDPAEEFSGKIVEGPLCEGPKDDDDDCDRCCLAEAGKICFWFDPANRLPLR